MQPEPSAKRWTAAGSDAERLVVAAEERVDYAFLSGNENRITAALKELQRAIRRAFPD